MYKLCMTEQSARRQREIEGCLFEVMKNKRYEDITVTELCERMNMPRKAFYRYFDGKDDTLFALIDHSIAEYEGFSESPGKESRRSLSLELEKYFIFWKNRHALLASLDRSGLVGTLLDRVINYPLGDRIALVKFLPDEDEEMRRRVFKFAICGLVYMMIEWYRDGFKTPTKEMALAARRMFEYPLFPSLDVAGFDL